MKILLLAIVGALGLHAVVPTTVFNGSGGTGNAGQFTFTVTDTLGAADIQYTQIDFRGANGYSECVLQQNNGGMGFRNQDGYTWTWALVGDPQVSSNDHCTLQRATSTLAQSGNVRTMAFTLQFSFNYPGPKTVWGVSAGSQGHNGWQQIGTWTVAGAPPPPPSTVMVNNGGSGASAMMSFKVTDVLGAADIDFTNIDIGGNGGGPNACVMQLHWGYIALQNDAANGWAWGIVGLDPPSNNSQCTVKRTTSTWSNSGNIRDMTFDLTFAPSFTGPKTVWAMSGGSMGYTPWTPIGTWTINQSDFSGGFNMLPVVSGVLVPDDYTGEMVTSTTSAGTASTYAVTLKSGRRVQLLRAGNIKVNRADYSNVASGDVRTYSFRLDVRQASKVRLGAVWETQYAVGDDPDIPYSKPQVTGPKGWYGSGVGWGAIDEGAEHSEDSQFTVTSAYLPGPMGVYLMDENWKQPVELTGTAEDTRIAQAAGFMNNSLRKMVIGPAIRPNPDKEYLDWLVGRWIADYGLTWLKPLLDGKTLDDLGPPDGKFGREVIECLRAVWGKSE